MASNFEVIGIGIDIGIGIGIGIGWQEELALIRHWISAS